MMKFIKKHYLIILAVIYLLWPLDLLPAIIVDDIGVLIGTALIQLIRDTFLKKKDPEKKIIDVEEVD